jgi:hypothetical protein
VLDLLDEMQSRDLVPYEITYNTVIHACAKGGESPFTCRAVAPFARELFPKSLKLIVSYDCKTQSFRARLRHE